MIHPRHSEVCQLALDFRDRLMPANAAVEPKIDGLRLLYIGNGHAVSREGAPVLLPGPLLSGLMAIEEALGGDRGWFIDAELAAPGGPDATRTAAAHAPHLLRLHLFDCLPVEAWLGDEPPHLLGWRDMPLRARRAALEDAFARASAPGLVLVPHRPATCLATVRAAAEAEWLAGGEGVMVKDLDAPYVRARSRAWLRLKRRATADVRVIDAVEGGGANRGRLGALVVDHAGTATRVGVGFSEAQRDLFWRDLRSIVGHVVEVAHLGALPSGALRSPSFLRVRSDKR